MTARRLRVAAAVVAALLLVAGGAGAAWAYWSSTATAATSVASGTVGITLGGAASLASGYTSSDRSRSAALTVTNTGTLAASYSLATTTSGSAPLASAVVVTRWSTTSASACSGSVPGSAVSGTWAAPPPMTGTLAAGAAQIWCVRTTITSAQVAALPGTSVTATLTATGANGAWTSTAAQSVTQTVAGLPIATMQCTPWGSPWGVVVSWDPPSGWGYHVEGLWLNGSYFSSQNSNFTWRYIDWDAIDDEISGHPGNPQTFTLEARAQHPVTNEWVVIAQRTIVTRVIDYGTYEHEVVQCT